MKKMLIFGGIIIALFAAIFAVTQMEEKNASTSQKIDNATSQTDGSDYYTNKISLSDLQKNLKEKKRRNSILLSNILRSLPKIISYRSTNG